MASKKRESSRFHAIIKTKHVFIEDDQVFLKRDTKETVLPDKHGEVWYPVNFQWIPVKELEQSLNHQSAAL